MEVLRAGRLFGAGLDVAQVEPMPPTDPLLALPGCVVTPHVGSATRRTRLANSGDQGATVYEGGANAWVASQTNAQGSVQATLSSVAATATTGNGKIYAVHGTFSATLVASGGGTGTVTMTIAF